MSSKFKSGMWDGYYNYKGKKQNLMFQMNFSLHSSGIKGNGTDDNFGYFTVDGKFNEKAPYACEFSFNFSNSIKMEFSGWRESDKGGIFGNWKGSNGSGAFAFAPSKETEEKMKQLEEQAQKNQRDILTSMGFPSELIEEAVKQNKGVEAAISWLTDKLNPPLSGEGTENTGSTVDESKVQQLISLGFEEEMVRQALEASNGNVDQAANFLFEGQA